VYHLSRLLYREALQRTRANCLSATESLSNKTQQQPVAATAAKAATNSQQPAAATAGRKNKQQQCVRKI